MQSTMILMLYANANCMRLNYLYLLKQESIKLTYQRLIEAAFPLKQPASGIKSYRKRQFVLQYQGETHAVPM